LLTYMGLDTRVYKWIYTSPEKNELAYMSNPATATSINKRVFDNRVYSFAETFSVTARRKQTGRAR